MSADNWTECPKCCANMRADAREDDLREDYYIGASGYELHISYDAKCRACGFEFHYSTMVPMLAGEGVRSDG